MSQVICSPAGKMFECRPETMVSSIKKVTDLPHNSLLFPGIYRYIAISAVSRDRYCIYIHL